MDNIILQYILDLLTSWSNSFNTWANEIGDKIASIKTNTDNLPGIKADTADIKDNTAAVISPINAINSNVASVASDVGNIEVDTIVIKNNASSIATSSGATAAYAEDIANNTLDCKNRLVTIGSDTTQIRADSDSIAADVTEIKNTLGLYLYNTIVTEDAEGSIADFDTDLKDYLQNAVVTIPADAGGISELLIVNQLTEQKKAEMFRGLLLGTYDFYQITGSETFSVTGSGQHVISGLSPIYSNLKKPATNLILGNIISSFCDTKTYQDLNVSGTTDGIGVGVSFIIIGSEQYDNWASLVGEYIIYECITPVTPTITKAQFETLCSAFGIDLNDYTVTFNSSITDGAEVDLLSGIVKINTSPVTYDSITPLAIRTFKGVNNIYSDIGDIDVTYRETLKHYLEKQNNNSRSLNRNVNLLRENIESDEDSDRREI